MKAYLYIFLFGGLAILIGTMYGVGYYFDEKAKNDEIEKIKSDKA